MPKESFIYCQRQAEEETRCKTQCDHCKQYYAPLENGSEIKKAKELAEAMGLVVISKFTRMKSYKKQREAAKECALIAVDEILKIEGNYLIERTYWQQVKIELEKL